MIDYTFTRIRKSESTSAIVSPSTMSMEIEETLRRISSHRGVKGVIICNSEGAPIRSNLPEDEEQTYSALISQLTSKANSVVRTLDEADELPVFRVRSKKHEIMVAPDKEYLLLVGQDPNREKKKTPAPDGWGREVQIL